MDDGAIHKNVLLNKALIPKILNLTSDTLIVLDKENRCVDLLLKTENPILNVNRQIIGQDFISLLPLETSILVEKELELTRKTGISSNVNYDLPTADKMFYFKLIAHKFDDDYILCQYRDITKRSNMKGRLRSAAIALLEVGKVAKISHWSFDPSSDTLSYPEYSSHEDLIFLDSQVIPVDLYLKNIHEDDRGLLKRFLLEYVDKPTTIEYRLIRKEKPIAYLRSTKYAQINGQKVISGFTQNVTDFMKNRHELEMLVSVVHNAPRSVIAAKNNGEVIFINKSGLRMSGLPEDQDISTLNVMNLIGELSTPDKWFALKEKLKHTEDGYRFRTKNPFSDSDIKETDCIASIIKNWEEEDIIWFFQHDISDQIRYQEQLLMSKEAAEESEKLKMAFISNMNHEIRTPLSAIIGLSMLIADTEEADLRHEYTKLVTSNSDQLLRLITDVLEMSKLDAGNMSLIPKLESMNTIFQELNLSFSHVEDKAKLHVDIPPNDLQLYLDKGRVMQLLINMINNSRKFTSASGRIDLSYTVEGDKLALKVQDNGIGIPQDKLNDIFNRFFKVNDSDVGTGLGLAICKGIVEQMNGYIEVESEENKGTTFRIYLPLVVDEI